MAISEEKLAEMRENSRAGAERQKQREETALKKYMTEREVNMSGMMTTSERIVAVAAGKNSGLSNKQISEKYNIPLGSIARLSDRAAQMGLIGAPAPEEDKPAEQSGVIDAAELTAAEREALVEEISAEISAEQEQPAEPKNEDSTAQMYEYACAIATMLKKLTIGKPFEVTLRAEESLYYLDVYAPNGTDSVEITWSRKAEAEDE